jgi:plastocyanin
MSAIIQAQPIHARPLAALIGAMVLLASLAGLAGNPPAVRAAEQAVQIGDGSFGPATLTVAVGDTVTWTNADSSPHTVTSEDGTFDSGNLDEGQVFSHTFTTPGTFAYRCEYHSDMTATVVVEAAASEATAAPPASTVAAPAASSSAAAAGQPDTALPTGEASEAPIAELLIGLGLLALAFGIVPPRALVPAPGHRSPVRDGGWRR